MEDAILMVKGDLAIPLANRYKPDWATICRKKGTSPETQQHSIMPGETKYNWSSQDITYGSVNWSRSTPNTDPLWPLNQIFTYCVYLRSRYGYIITDKELVLFRIGFQGGSAESPNDWETIQRSLRSNGKIELYSIPWSNHGRKAADREELTVNAALWWIHLQAVRERAINWKYPPLIHEVLGPSRKDSPWPFDDDIQHCKTPDMVFNPENVVDDPLYSFSESHNDVIPPLRRSRLRSATRTEREGSGSTIAASEYDDHGVGTAQGSFESEPSEISGRITRSKRKALSNNATGTVETRSKRKKRFQGKNPAVE